MQHLVDEQPGRATGGGRRRQPVEDLADEFAGRCVTRQRRLAGDDHGRAPERLDPHAGPLQGGGVLLDEFEFGRRQFDPLGNEQRLDLQSAGGDRGLEPLVEDPLVERMLVDDLDSVAALDHDVPVVHLHGALAVVRHGWCGVFGLPGRRRLGDGGTGPQPAVPGLADRMPRAVAGAVGLAVEALAGSRCRPFGKDRRGRGPRRGGRWHEAGGRAVGEKPRPER